MQRGGSAAALALDVKGETPFHWAARGGKAFYDIIFSSCSFELSTFAATMKNQSGKTPAEILQISA